jgi:hypothetical protein
MAPVLVLILLLSGIAASDVLAQSDTPVAIEPAGNTTLQSETSARKSLEIEQFDLLQKITHGDATLPEIRTVLSNTNDVAGLTNTMHMLYSMRLHRPIGRLLNDLWNLNKTNYPELAWEHLQKVPVRIALASTINRIQIFKAEQYKNFIREHKYDEHEFHRAQVVISLGLNGDPVDVAYIKEMAEGDNVYVSQSAITALGLMAHPQARNALMELARKYTDDDRGKLIREVFKSAYPVQ